MKRPLSTPEARRARRRFSLVLILCVACFAIGSRADAADDVLSGYANHVELQRQIGELAEHDWVTTRSLAKTIEGRDVTLLTLGIGDVDSKPAIAIVANVDAGQLVGTEVAMRMVRQLVHSSSDPSVRSLLDRFTIYIIPRPSPDASEKCFATPRRRPAGNARRTDDDRDHKVGEDPPEDLNGDGVITMMRVADPTGPHRAHPDDPRLMIKADRTKGEQGAYRLYVEGVDNDGDGRWNEDAGDGVSFNRNFTFDYPFFKANAGPHQVSEAETRAVADFLFDHTNIAAVLTFSPDDNLIRPWKTGKNPTRIPVYIDAGDLTYAKQFGKKYRRLTGLEEAPPVGVGPGSFAKWGYFHYGRWTLATPGWAIPEHKSEATAKDDSRGKREWNALRWMAANDIDGFVSWQAVDHPDFPGEKVEVGGVKPLVLDNPPVSYLDDLAKNHTRFVRDVLAMMPSISLHDVHVISLGSGVYRVKAAVLNEGQLPTSSETGRRTRLTQKVQIALELPEGAELLRGPIRTQLQPIPGRGGTGEHSWLLRVKDEQPRKTTIRAWAPPVGDDEVEIELK